MHLLWLCSAQKYIMSKDIIMQEMHAYHSVGSKSMQFISSVSEVLDWHMKVCVTSSDCHNG
jgi:hypothetical protein